MGQEKNEAATIGALRRFREIDFQRLEIGLNVVYAFVTKGSSLTQYFVGYCWQGMLRGVSDSVLRERLAALQDVFDEVIETREDALAGKGVTKKQLAATVGKIDKLVAMLDEEFPAADVRGCIANFMRGVV